tara:strand:- start:1743 stop:1982 length:240 start_codon:yes stop_codon:yes gene_type:complete
MRKSEIRSIHSAGPVDHRIADPVLEFVSVIGRDEGKLQKAIRQPGYYDIVRSIRGNIYLAWQGGNEADCKLYVGRWVDA